MTADWRQLKVVAVDDDPFTLKLLGHQLSQLGFGSVVTCTGATEALQLISAGEAEPVDLVITDLQMPGMDGIEFVRHLVECGYQGHLLLLSGEDEWTVQAAARLAKTRNLKLLGYLTKPVGLDLLRQRIEGMGSQEQRRARSERKIYQPDEVRRAIEQGELINYYQPKVALPDGALVGVESLVRWQHPEDGLVFPDQFVAVAEENGLIDSLTRVVLGNAVRQEAAWRGEGLALKVAVNVSMDDLCVLDFPEMVMQTISEAGGRAEGLILEVTESRLMLDQVKPLDVLARLRLKRVHLSIDDFGTGHSSLSQLRDLPFDELKLDMSFVHGAHRDRKRHAILEASLGMARRLGMKVVAEGVEDRDDWDHLRQLGCDFAQGYFCARPMPGEELIKWSQEWMVRREELVA